MPRIGPIECPPGEVEALDPVVKDADVVMLAIYSHYSLRAVQITEYIHKKYPGMKVIWGGPHCVAAPETSLRYADAVCFSEGDIAVPELARRMAAGESYLDTPNMAFLENGSVIKNEVLPPYKDLDSLPFSDFGLEGNFILDGTLMPLDRERMQQYFTIYPFLLPTFWTLTSRGCPHHCSYCNNCQYIKMFGKNSIRMQSVGRFMDELEAHLGALDFFTRIGFGDDDFFVRPTSQIEEFAERYKKNVDLPFMLALSARTYKQEKMEILLDAGIRIAQIGVQSGSDRILREVYDRKISLDKIKKIVHELTPRYKTHRLNMILDFIVDNPYETREDIRQTYHYLLDMPKHTRIHIYTLSFFPGTPLYDRALADNHIGPFEEGNFRAYTGRVMYQLHYESFLIFLFRFMHLSGWRKVVPTFLMRFLGSHAVCAVANVLPGKFWSLGIKAVRKITPRFAQE
jgi:radical SAM superfamily enzyme YgiQ (UPF0313 family)